MRSIRSEFSTDPLAGLLPDGIAFVRKWGSAPFESLPVEEQALVSAACGKRKTEFATGRWCARAALEIKGIGDFKLLADAHRAPIWPRGIVGSITHTDGFCAAAVGLRSSYAGIGIDAEVDGRVGQDLWPNLFTADEVCWLDGLPEPRRTSMATVLFSAKESFYKAQYSFTRSWLDFTAAAVIVEDRQWHLRLVTSGKAFERLPRPITGNFVIVNQCVVTAIAVPAFAIDC